jgi:hypothetical protein
VTSWVVRERSNGEPSEIFIYFVQKPRGDV